MAKRTVIPTLVELLNGRQRIDSSLKYKYNKSDFEFTIKYHGREGIIWIGSGDSPDSLKGPNIGSALIDEPFIQPKEVLDQMLARVRDMRASKREIRLTGTPEELNWGYDICEGEEKENYDVDMIQASTFANKALPEEYANRMKKAYTEKAGQAYVDGQFVSLSTGHVYYAFSKSENVIALGDQGLELHAGMDFNVNPMAAVVFWKAGNHMHIIDEIELPNSDTEYMCQHLEDKYKKRITTIYPDATGRARKTSAGGKTDFWYIDTAGFIRDVGTINPPRKDRYNAVNGKFKPRDHGVPTLTIEPSCKKLIRYLSEYSHEKMNTDAHKAMSHLLDALGYPVVRLFPVRPLIRKHKLSGY